MDKLGISHTVSTRNIHGFPAKAATVGVMDMGAKGEGLLMIAGPQLGFPEILPSLSRCLWDPVPFANLQ